MAWQGFHNPLQFENQQHSHHRGCGQLAAPYQIVNRRRVRAEQGEHLGAGLGRVNGAGVERGGRFGEPERQRSGGGTFPAA